MSTSVPITSPERKTSSAFIAEFIGTFLLVLWIAMLLSIYQTGQAGLGYVDFTVIGLLHGFLLLMLIGTLGTSTGYFNPAVTLMLAALRRIRPSDALIYVLLQLAAGVLGALVAKLLLDDEGEAVDYGANAISEKFLQGDVLPGMVAELIGTFALCWAVMGFVVNPRGDARMAPVGIGLTLGFAVMVIGPLTGAGLNPARAFGPGLVGDFHGFGDFLLAFVVGPCLGALLAGLLYQLVIIAPQQRPVEQPPAAARDDTPATP